MHHETSELQRGQNACINCRCTGHEKTAGLKIDYKADANQLGHDGRIQFVNTGRVTNAKRRTWHANFNLPSTAVESALIYLTRHFTSFLKEVM